MDPVDLRKMVSSLADAFNEYNNLFNDEEQMFIEHCQIKLDNDEQLTNQEIFRLNAFYKNRGIEAMRLKEEEERVERAVYERKQKAFRDRVGVDPLEIIDTMLGTDRLSQDSREWLERFRRDLKLDGKLSGMELKILFEIWRDFTTPMWLKAFRFVKGSWSGLDVTWLEALLGVLVLFPFIFLFLWWAVSSTAEQIERRSQGDPIAKIHCTGGHYRMKTVEDKGEVWEGFTTDQMFVQAPKAVCSIEFLDGKPRQGETP